MKNVEERPINHFRTAQQLAALREQEEKLLQYMATLKGYGHDAESFDGDDGQLILDGPNSELIRLAKELADLRYQIATAKIVTNENKDTIGYGSTFRLRSDLFGEEKLTLVPTDPRHDRDEISTDSPLGKAVLGLGVDAKITLPFDGEPVIYTIVDIDNSHNVKKESKQKVKVK